MSDLPTVSLGQQCSNCHADNEPTVYFEGECAHTSGWAYLCKACLLQGLYALDAVPRWRVE